MATPSPTRTAETTALARQVEEAMGELAAQLAVGHTDGYLELLRFYARFHRYSVRNVVLILRQCPHATRVASYRRWQELGRQVAKGERSIRIWCPILKLVADEETGEDVETLVGFRPCGVFDASQLADIVTNPLPTLWRHLPDDAEAAALYERAASLVAAAGIAVIEQPLPPGIQGISEGGRIRIRWRLDARNQLMVLVHELAHELAGHHADPDKPAALRELEAESTSFVVCAVLGLEHPFAADYLLSHRVTPEELSASLATIQRLVREILAFFPEERHQSAA